MSPDEFRRLGHELVEWIAAYRENLDSYRVMSNVSPGEIRARLPAEPPNEGGSLDSIVEDLEAIVMPGITHWNHPRFFAYFPSNAGLASVLADLLSSGLGVQGMSWQTSPAATELEEAVVDWLRQMLGLPESFVGVIQDTASTATLVALLCARERSTEFSMDDEGLQSIAKPLVVYTSDQSHSSVEKAALLAGFGRHHIRSVSTDQEFALEPEALRSQIESDLTAGLVPSVIVATVGTTATTAIDPVEAIAEIASEFGLWLHVDAAMAGSAMILPECRIHWKGVERADSLVFNPHKWLGVAFDCSVYFVENSEHLVRVMSTNPSYLRTVADDQVTNFRDWGIPLGRRFRALKLWFMLRDLGVAGLRDRLARDIENARWFADQVAREPEWQIVAPVPFQTVSIRYVPEGLSGEEADDLNLEIVERINASGRAYLTSTVIRGRRIIRVSIGAELTERRHVMELWDALRTEARSSRAH